jgi:excisionase family DNA binding protein
LIRQFFTRTQVCKLLGISKSALQQWVARGHFPQPKIKVQHLVRWTRQQIDQWVEAGGKLGNTASPAK